jgi:hypothetical protein
LLREWCANEAYLLQQVEQLEVDGFSRRHEALLM